MDERKKKNPFLPHLVKKDIDQILLSSDPSYVPPVTDIHTEERMPVGTDIKPEKKKCHFCLQELAGVPNDTRPKIKGNLHPVPHVCRVCTVHVCGKHSTTYFQCNNCTQAD